MFLKLTNLLESCQLKFSSDEKGEFEGYASVFNANDAVNDTIAPGAFEKSLAKGRFPKMFVNHKQHEVPVGDWLELYEDSKGLMGRGKIDLNHKDGPTVYSALKRGAMDGISIGFTMDADDFEAKSDGGRLIKNLDLMECSIVSFPCEGQARISAVKADLAGLTSLSDFENYLRDAGGFSKSMAVSLVSQIVKASRSDSEAEEQRIAGELNAKALKIIQSLKNL
jgi:HK97 family phage prohead protease